MDSFEKFYPLAIRYITIRPRSEHELRMYFAKKKVSPEIAEKIIDRLKQQKFLDDKAFAAWWIDQRIRVKQSSMRIIQMELKQKGIGKEMIEEILKDKDTKEVERESIEKLLEKKMRRSASLSKEEAYKKLGQFLQRRGFGYAEIKPELTKFLEKEYNKR